MKFTLLTGALVILTSAALMTGCINGTHKAEEPAAAATTACKAGSAEPEAARTGKSAPGGRKEIKNEDKAGRETIETEGSVPEGHSKEGPSPEGPSQEAAETAEEYPQYHTEDPEEDPEEEYDVEDEPDREDERDTDFLVKDDEPKTDNGTVSHTHDWVEQTKNVHHDETGHYEEIRTGTRTVVDEEAWDEPVYETRSICNACGYEADSTEEINDHLDSHYDPDLGYIDASYRVEDVVVDTVHHPEKTHEEPVYEDKWVLDSEAWDEEVVTGYRCSICGATK